MLLCSPIELITCEIKSSAIQISYTIGKLLKLVIVNITPTQRNLHKILFRVKHPDQRSNLFSMHDVLIQREDFQGFDLTKGVNHIDQSIIFSYVDSFLR